MKRLRRVLLSALIGVALLTGISIPGRAETDYRHHRSVYRKSARRRTAHRRHVRTEKRVGAAGGAAIGALAGGGQGAAIGAAAGAGGGALYDAHKRSQGR